MQAKNLLPSVKILKIGDAESSGTTTIESAVVDTQGYEGVMFFGSINVTNAGNKLVIQQGSEADGSDMADLAAEAGGKQELVVDVFRPKPSGRYLRATIVRGSATSVRSIWAILYCGRMGKIDNVTASMAATLVASPD